MKFNLSTIQTDRARFDEAVRNHVTELLASVDQQDIAVALSLSLLDEEYDNFMSSAEVDDEAEAKARFRQEFVAALYDEWGSAPFIVVEGSPCADEFICPSCGTETLLGSVSRNSDGSCLNADACCSNCGSCWTIVASYDEWFAPAADRR